MNEPLLTPEQAKAALEAHGLSAMDVARTLGVPRHAVDDVLRNRGCNKIGDRHKVAVYLRIKPAPKGTPLIDLNLAEAKKPPRRSRKTETGAAANHV